MTKRFLLFTAFCLAFCMIYAQNTIYTCNGKYRVELPSKVELQNSELNDVKRVVSKGKKAQVNISNQTDKIVFQQRGMNADQKSAYQKYCRVIIEFFKEDRNDPVWSRGEKITVDRDILYAVEQSAKESCKKMNTPFVKLITIEGLNINGFPALFYSYKRKGWEGKQPPVIVNVYQIFNRYESINLIFSYREAERENWKDIHNNIIKTFSFTKKY